MERSFYFSNTNNEFVAYRVYDRPSVCISHSWCLQLPTSISCQPRNDPLNENIKTLIPKSGSTSERSIAICRFKGSSTKKVKISDDMTIQMTFRWHDKTDVNIFKIIYIWITHKISSNIIVGKFMLSSDTSISLNSCHHNFTKQLHNSVWKTFHHPFPSRCTMTIITGKLVNFCQSLTLQYNSDLPSAILVERKGSKAF